MNWLKRLFKKEEPTPEPNVFKGEFERIMLEVLADEDPHNSPETIFTDKMEEETEEREDAFKKFQHENL